MSQRYGSKMRFFLMLFILVLSPASTLAQSGISRVIDGDTLDVGGERVRIHGIDAPERGQTCTIEKQVWECGVMAWERLVQIIADGIVICDPRDLDQYGRIVAVCSVDGQDIGAQMVSEGWALAYREYSTDYVPTEDAASNAGVGVWLGEFVPPWNWRRGVRLEAAESIENPRGCDIKGNISRDGERIYHLPGGQNYGVTVVSPSRGERWFCAEVDAVDAGWRRAQR